MTAVLSLILVIAILKIAEESINAVAFDKDNMIELILSFVTVIRYVLIIP
jgi:hypothetical protein